MVDTASELLVGVELVDDRYRERRSELVEGAIERVEIIAFDLEIAATARATNRIVITTDATAFEGPPGVSHRLLSADAHPQRRSPSRQRQAARRRS